MAKKKKVPAPAWPYASVVRVTADASRGQWVKSVRGRRVSLGPLADPERALRYWQEVGPALLRGEPPPVRGVPGLAVGEMVGLYLEALAVRAASGDIAPVTHRNYRDACRVLVLGFGKTRPVASLVPADFDRFRSSLSEGAPVQRAALVTRVRSVFRWAHDTDLITELPRWGSAFRGSSARERRVARAERGKRLFSAGQVRALLGAATPSMRAMILLGLNAAFGNTDVATLTIGEVDWSAGVIGTLRHKSAIERCSPLWPETLEALRPLVGGRGGADLVFVTRFGRPWIRVTDRSRVDSVTNVFSMLLRGCGLGGAGLGFYSLRHTCRTVADDRSRDQHAICRLCGHTVPGMAGLYVEEISVDRVRVVADAVRAWLFD